jgi:hypothetical protein
LADPNKIAIIPAPKRTTCTFRLAALQGGAARANPTYPEQDVSELSMWKWVAMAFAIAIGLAGFMALLSPPAKPITLPQSKRAAGTDADVRVGYGSGHMSQTRRRQHK